MKQTQKNKQNKDVCEVFMILMYRMKIDPEAGLTSGRMGRLHPIHLYHLIQSSTHSLRQTSLSVSLEM